jgi:uracil permease
MKLVYGIKDKPRFSQLIVFAFQQLLAIMAATIAVPMITSGSYECGDVSMSTAAALVGAGFGTLIYLLFTKRSSPVFLGSSFAFLGSMSAAFAGAASMQVGYLGLILGAVFAGLVYVVLAIVIKCVGVNWINKLMPAVVIGPTVAIIGLSLAGNAIGDLQTASAGGSTYLALVCGLVTLAVTVLCSVYGKNTVKMIPFVLGILAGYAVALVLTIIGTVSSNDALLIINLDSFKELVSGGVSVRTFINVDLYKQLTISQALKGVKELNGAYVLNILFAYVPVAFVVFAEHIADHKNISSIIEKDLLQDPGLSRTLLGDGVGSMVGSLFGGCPNTTYGESVGCVAISGNASVVTIFATALMAILVAFINPFVAFLSSIPSCCMGGVCIALYGFIAVSGLKMVQKVNLEDNHNLFVVSVILIAGIGGLSLSFTLPVSGGKTITITAVACALILGILTNVMLSGKKKASDAKNESGANPGKKKG